MTDSRSWFDELRCPQCLGTLVEGPVKNGVAAESFLSCSKCQEDYPVVDEIPRLLPKAMRQALLQNNSSASGDRVVATARSFGYEWSRFSEMRPEWERNFLDYLAPHGPDFFAGKRVLDAGCGAGRHTFFAAKFGADVRAMDLGPAIEVAHKNTGDLGNVRLVQADLNHPPFASESFDFIYSLGVLHHLPHPEAAFRNLVRFLKPGSEIQIYLYWKPEGQPVKAFLLTLVTGVRAVTTRMPYSLLHALSYPFAALAFLFFVWPCRLLHRFSSTRRIAEKIPMKQYAQYPFRVCVNDQFDRFSAPIENRYSKPEVEAWFKRAGLEAIEVRPHFGWVARGRKA